MHSGGSRIPQMGRITQNWGCQPIIWQKIPAPFLNGDDDLNRLLVLDNAHKH